MSFFGLPIFDNMKAEGDHVTVRYPESKRKTFSVLTSLALLSVAATFSAFFPSSLPSLHDLSLSLCRKAATPEWKDDIWPIRQQTSWDISTDFDHPRVLEVSNQYRISVNLTIT